MDTLQERIRIGQAINLASDYVLAKEMNDITSYSDHMDRVDLHTRKYYKFLKDLQDQILKEIEVNTVEAKNLKLDKEQKKLIEDI